MKRFSRRSKKSVDNGMKDGVDGLRNNSSNTPSPHIEKSKSNLIKGFRKRFQSARASSTRETKEHIYASAPSPVDVKSSPTATLNNNVTESDRTNGNFYHTPRPRASSVPNDDHDYSRVSENDDDDETTPPVPPRTVGNSGTNERDVYLDVSGENRSIATPSPTKGTVENADNGQDSGSAEVTNINNSNDSNSVTSMVNGNAEMMPGTSSAARSIIAAHPLMEEFHKLAKKGWYWGPLSREQAEKKLRDLPEASFLVRDSSDDRYLLSLSFRSNNRTLHTRIEHSGIKFSFYEDSPSQSYTSVIKLIENSVQDSNEQGVFCYSRSRHPNAQTYPVRLMHPVSRFTEVRPLQDLCRFVIRQSTRIDHIQSLPVPNQIKGYLNQSYF